MKSEYVAAGSTEDKSLNLVSFILHATINLTCISPFFREEKEDKNETKDEKQIKK